MGLIGAQCVWGSWGRAHCSKRRACKEGKKNSLALRSLRRSAFLVSPNFRENHAGRRGGRELRHFILDRLESLAQTGRRIRTRSSRSVVELGSAVEDHQVEERTGGAMSRKWRDDDEDFRVGGVKSGTFKSKPRFSFHEVKVLLEAVKKNRYILLRKFNQGVSAETKKFTWTEITDQINGLGENHREVRQIMKKWADLKCDGKRRIVALRAPSSRNARKKNMGPVERMVHKILMMSPKGNGDSDLDLCEDENFKLYSKTPPPNAAAYSYLSVTDSSHSVPDRFSFDMSPLSSPEKDLSEQSMDFDDNEDSLFSNSSSLPPTSSTPLEKDPLPDDAQPRIKPIHTYSRNGSQNNNSPVQNHTPSISEPGPSSPAASTSSALPAVSDSDAGSSSAVLPKSTEPASSSSASFVPPHPPPSSSSSTSVTAKDTTSEPAPSFSSASIQPAASSTSSHRPPRSSSSSSSVAPPNPSASPRNSHDPLPAGASSRRVQDQVAQMSSQSLEQQRASRMLLTSVSRSLEMLAQSVQLLVESQQEFVQESLQLQRETVDVLRDFSSTALTMLRDKSNSGQLPPRHHQHPASHF